MDYDDFYYEVTWTKNKYGDKDFHTECEIFDTETAAGNYIIEHLKPNSEIRHIWISFVKVIK